MKIKKYLVLQTRWTSNGCSWIMGRIWDYFEKNSDYERAFEVDFEKYAKEDEIEIYVSIK